MLSRRRSSPGGSSGPHAKRPRGVNVGEPVENEATARRKLEEAGFNPDNASEPATPRELEYGGTTVRVTPMVHFSRMGDLPMCRYLFTQGAHECIFGKYTYSDHQWWFPMYAAANSGHLAICEWLHKMGAQEDVWRTPGSSIFGWRPLGTACCNGRTDVCRWLILNEALHRKGSFDSEIAAKDLEPPVAEEKVKKKTRADLLTWAQDMISLRTSFCSVFLMGTLPAPDNHSNDLQKLLSRKLGSAAAAGIIIGSMTTETQHSLWQELRPLQSPLCVFAGFTGILEIIADFAGVRRGRDLQIARDLVQFMTNHQFRGDDDDDDDDDGDGDENDNSNDEDESDGDY